MIKMIITGAVVSKGANDGPAIKFSEKGDFARFRIGYKIYDTRAENNHRWINLTVKAFGDLCDRISKMDLNEQVNEAIASLKSSILISSQELPVEESWPDICRELERNDLFGASCQADGILIEFER